MKQNKLWMVLIGLIAAALLVYNYGGKSAGANIAYDLAEREAVNIPLAGALADRNAEISGLAWMGNNLILLPQYPTFADSSEDGFLYYIPSEEINAYLDGSIQGPIEARAIKLIAPDLTSLIPNFQGFESIGTSGLNVFLTIEAGEGADMRGYLVKGIMSPDLSLLLLDTDRLVELPAQAKSANHADESILVLQNEIYTFYETTGASIVRDPVARRFDFDLNPLGDIPMTNVEYRLTDTTPVSLTEFWGINYFFPGDSDLKPASDPLSEKYGLGASHANYEQIERLVKFEITPDGITFAEAAPIPLELGQDARNWEGLTILYGRGFLIASDKFPTTLLSFIPAPEIFE
jgi:hypothetical protein